jgi:dephospho-CoA kinase
MLKIGITGGIGAGKSTVCRLFEGLQIPVYYADDRAKWLMQHDEELVDKLKTAFGEDIYTQDGSLDRPKLANIVFNNPEALKTLNSITHPEVLEDGERWQRMQKLNGAIYTLKEAALLYESGSNEYLDKIIVVAADQESRIERVMQRDNCSREQVLARLNKQMPQADKVKLADWVIYNNDNDDIMAAVQKIHRQILALSQQQ